MATLQYKINIFQNWMITKIDGGPLYAKQQKLITSDICLFVGFCLLQGNSIDLREISTVSKVYLFIFAHTPNIWPYIGTFGFYPVS